MRLIYIYFSINYLILLQRKYLNTISRIALIFLFLKEFLGMNKQYQTEVLN